MTGGDETPAELAELRHSIDNIDAALLYLLAERFKCTRKVGRLKAARGLPPADLAREATSDRPVARPGGERRYRPGIRRKVPRLSRHRSDPPSRAGPGGGRLTMAPSPRVPRWPSSEPATTSARRSPSASPPRAIACSAADGTAKSSRRSPSASHAAGGRFEARTLDAREEEAVAAFMAEADADQPLEAAIFNVGANVNFPILETTERVFRKVWEMACAAGFLTGREAARRMLPQRAPARSSSPARPPPCAAARATRRSPPPRRACAPWRNPWRASSDQRGIHVAHLVIDAGVDTAFVRERIAVGARAPKPSRRSRPTP